MVMSTMVEQSFVTTLIKSDGSILPIFSRPAAAVLLWPLAVLAWSLAPAPHRHPTPAVHPRALRQTSPPAPALRRDAISPRSPR